MTSEVFHEFVTKKWNFQIPAFEKGITGIVPVTPFDMFFNYSNIYPTIL